MGDVIGDASCERVREDGSAVVRVSGGSEEEQPMLATSLGQLLELPPHVDDAAVSVPPEPPDLSPGPAHKV